MRESSQFFPQATEKGKKNEREREGEGGRERERRLSVVVVNACALFFESSRPLTLTVCRSFSSILCLRVSVCSRLVLFCFVLFCFVVVLFYHLPRRSWIILVRVAAHEALPVSSGRAQRDECERGSVRAARI